MITIELPADLRCAAKAKAALENKTLRAYLTELVREDMRRAGMAEVLRTEESVSTD